MAKSKKIEISYLTSHLGYWMRLISNNVSFAFAQKLESSGVTVAEWVVLREMYESSETTSPSAVAELTGLTRGAVSKLISRLLEKDLVSRRESSEDRRYQDIQLTAKAIQLVPKLSELADTNDKEFFGGLTKTERTHLKALLEKLAEIHKFKSAPIE